ncbi:MAG TPA: hypothetical protein VMG38_02060 [Trebonia sp.]|nr:hypothetical protein [Trebonia sp.]
MIIPVGPVADCDTPEQAGVPPGPVSMLLDQVGWGCPDSNEVEKLVAVAGQAVSAAAAAAAAAAVAGDEVPAEAGPAAAATADDEVPAMAPATTAADTTAASRLRRDRR